MYSFCLISVLVFLSISPFSSSRILGIFPFKSSIRHHSIHEPLMKNLAAKGYKVTIISHFASISDNENYLEIRWPGGKIASSDECSIHSTAEDVEDSFSTALRKSEVEESACVSLLQMDYIQSVQNSPEKIDLIIAEIHHTLCFHLLAEKLNVPLVVITPTAFSVGLDLMLGNPNNPAYLPVFWSFDTEMHFSTRIFNNLSYIIFYVCHYSFFNYYMPTVAVKYFNMQLPPATVLHNRTALVLYNNHFTFIPRPNVPNAIDVAGIHIQDPQPLDHKIQDFIDEAEYGAIFVSFESATTNESPISSDIMCLLVKAFSDIPQRILWKMDASPSSTLPRNVKIKRWFPQRDILEHPNVRVFISHCEMLNIQEAIHTNSPIICIPLFHHQKLNAEILAKRKAAIIIDYKNLSKEILLRSLREILDNSTYAINMHKLSAIFKDRPMKPMDTALYWIEYVLRHDGAPHMRVAGADMPFYKYLNLDILAILFIVISVPSGMINYHLLRIVCTELIETFICFLEFNSDRRKSF